MKEQYVFGLSWSSVHQSILGFDYAHMQYIVTGDQDPEGMGRHSCYDKNICIIGFDHDGFATLLCGMSGMYKDPAVSFLIETFVETIQTSFRNT